MLFSTSLLDPSPFPLGRSVWLIMRLRPFNLWSRRSSSLQAGSRFARVFGLFTTSCSDLMFQRHCMEYSGTPPYVGSISRRFASAVVYSPPNEDVGQGPRAHKTAANRAYALQSPRNYGHPVITTTPLLRPLRYYGHPVYAVTPLLRSPRYYGNFFCPRETPINFLIRKPRWYGQRTHSTSSTSIILCNFTPFIRPLQSVMFIFLIKVSLF